MSEERDDPLWETRHQGTPRPPRKKMTMRQRLQHIQATVNANHPKPITMDVPPWEKSNGRKSLSAAEAVLGRARRIPLGLQGSEGGWLEPAGADRRNSGSD